ncbi:MAG: hypothetical protein FWF86_03200 [Clostridia bacterium]|nr:hypothetical protein [Clostridia bacterium]
MERFLLDNIPVTVTLEDIIQTLRLEEEEDIDLITGLFAKARELARPKALYRTAYVEEIQSPWVTIGGVTFTSDVLAARMEDVHKVFAYVCTCGVEVDDWSHLEKDNVVSLWLDIIKERFLHDAVNVLRDDVKNRYGLDILSSINPGSGDVENWPITQQNQLFFLIGGVRPETGIHLTESFLMLPTKSTSGLLYGSSTEFVNCLLCKRINCPNRRAEYTPRAGARA